MYNLGCGWQTVSLSDIVVFVVGNKIDLEQNRKVQVSRPIRQYKQPFDIDCWQVSAKTGHNINQMFQSLFQKIYEKSNSNQSVFISKLDVTYSQIDRGSYPRDSTSMLKNQILGKQGKQGKQQLNQISQIIVEQNQEFWNSVRKSVKSPIKRDDKNGRMSLDATKKDRGEKKKKGCCGG